MAEVMRDDFCNAVSLLFLTWTNIGDEMSNEKASEAPAPVTRDEVQRYIDDIEKKVVESNEAYLHSVLALDRILRLPNASEVIDETLKGQMKDLWIKLKAAGIKLSDPPILFGLPENFGIAKTDGGAAAGDAK